GRGGLLPRGDRRGGAVLTVRRELEAREEELPALVDGPRIGLPAPVLLRDVVLVGERQPLDAVHGNDVLFSGRGQRWPPCRPSSGSAVGLPNAAPVMNAGLGEARLQRALGAVALADGTERGGIGAIRRHGEERLRRRALQRAEHLHLVADLLAALEVEGH